MTRWIAAIAALSAIAAVIVVAQVLPWPLPAASRGDFRPFVMTIEEWDSVRVSNADGRTIGGTSVYRLEYQHRGQWTLTLASDELGSMAPGQGKACRNGAYGDIAVDGTFRLTSTDPGFCNGAGRWVHYGLACCYSWKKEVANGVATYTSPGERVVFDLGTGLPLLYEAGPVDGAVGHRTIYRFERWLTDESTNRGNAPPWATATTDGYRNDGAYPLRHWAGKFVIIVDDGDAANPSDRRPRAVR